MRKEVTELNGGRGWSSKTSLGDNHPNIHGTKVMTDDRDCTAQDQTKFLRENSDRFEGKLIGARVVQTWHGPTWQHQAMTQQAAKESEPR